MFNCKVCEERNLRVSDLKKEIEFLKRLLSPSPSLPTLNLEENLALDGAGGEELPNPEETEEQRVEREKIESERDAILSGNY